MRLCWIYCFVFLASALAACESPDSSATDLADAGAEPGLNPDSGPDPDSGVDKTEEMFASNRVIDIQIQIAKEDWDILRYEGRGLATQKSRCEDDYEYTYFTSTVTIDGETVENVGIRKKGYIGSLSAIRPSIKLNFQKFVDDQYFSGMKRMTLNNDKQDPSHTHQVMSYALFRQAGVIAPRANFARVTVNGEDLGIYSHVESIKKPFIARHFDDNDGNLYEGQGADFTPERVSYLERKTNEGDGTTEPDRSDTEALTDALQLDDSQMVAAVEKLVNLDSFYTFWAMEVILGHWDGYSGDLNNYYVYNDPQTGLFHFIPWGTDGTFSEKHAFLPDIPRSVYAMGRLANRLYNYPKTRTIYHQRLKTLLDELWDVKALTAEADRIGKLTLADAASTDKARDFLINQKDVILGELKDTGPKWPYPPFEQEKQCNPPIEISGTFHTKWYTTEAFAPHEDISLNLTMGGELQTFEAIYATAGPGPESAVPATIRFLGQRADANPLMIVLVMPLSAIKKGETRFHAMEVFGMLLEVSPTDKTTTQLGFIGNGTITLDAAGTDEGSDIAGDFAGLLSQ